MKVTVCKRVLSLVVIIVLTIGLLPVMSIPAVAEDRGLITFRATTGDTLTMTMVRDQLAAAGVNSGDTFSATFDNSVTVIDEGAFYGNTGLFSGLMSVVIPNGVRSIGDMAFSGCVNLSSVTIPDSVQLIGSSIWNGAFVFSGCTNLKEINVSADNSIYSSADGVLFDKDKTSLIVYPALKTGSFTIPDSVISISGIEINSQTPDDYWYNAFSNCINLTEINVNQGNSIFSSFDGVLYDKDKTVLLLCPAGKVGSISIPDSVNVISGIELIRLYPDLTELYYIPHAFSGCSKLSEINVSSGNGVYSSVDGVVFDKDKSSLLLYPFGKTGGFEIPSGISSIGYVFSNCIGLESITIPDNVTFLTYDMFSNCINLKAIHVSQGNPYYSSDDGVVFNKSKTSLIIFPSGKTGEYIIPSGVTSIEQYAFYNNNNLTSVTIPDSMASITYNTFYNCVNLQAIHVGQGNANYSSDDGVVFNKSKTSLMIYPRGKIGEYIIPSGVTFIGENAFYYNNNLTSVTLPASMTSIGRYAFSYCNLSNIIIPTSLRTISGYAFYNCSGLTGVNIPNSVTTIEQYAFYWCSDLINVTIGNGLTTIVSNILYYCGSLESVIIGSGVRTLSADAFSGCNHLTAIIIDESNSMYASDNGVVFNKNKTSLIMWPLGRTGEYDISENVTSIGTYAFYNCRFLTAISIPESVTTIGTHAFRGCTSLTGIAIPNNVRTIANYIFYECISLKSVVISNSTTSIGSYAFYNCSNLANVVIPGNVTSIGSRAFYGCSSMTSIVLPDSLTTLEDYAFGNCYSITSIIIPNSLTSIVDNTFYACTNLEKVFLGSGVRTIGNNAFSGCTNLNEINVDPDNSVYTSIDGVLYNKNITSLIRCPLNRSGEYIIPDSVTSIGTLAFSNCGNLTSVIIPNNVTSIGAYAFYGCSKLTGIIIPDGVRAIADYTFYNCSSLASISLPVNVTSVGSYAFYSCTSLTSINISANVTTIGDYAFYSCRGLTSVVIPAGVTSVGNYAFAQCNNLTDIILPDKMTSIANNLFYNCSNLTKITIPNGVTSIGNYAFYSCDNLTSVIIPASVTSMGTYAFTNCGKLTDIIIPDKVTTIANSLFSNCENLTSVIIPDGVTSIGNSAFAYCYNLETITIPISVVSIATNAFTACENLLIRCVNGSYALEYAISNDIAYELLDANLITISINIKDPNQQTLSSGYTVNWYREGSDQIIGTGNILRNLSSVDGLLYDVILLEEIGVLYRQPPRQAVVIVDENYDIDFVLEKIPEISITGRVVDNNLMPIGGANVAVEQVLNNKFNRSSTTTTDADGMFEITVLSDKTDITFSKDGYYDTTMPNISAAFSSDKYNMGDVVLRQLSTNRVVLELIVNTAVKDGEQASAYMLNSASNIDFSLFNKTKSADITDFIVQYPYILIEDDSISANDLIEVKITDNLSRMSAPAAEFILDAELKGKVTIYFTENGMIEASVLSSQNTQDIAMLFNEYGEYLATYWINNDKLSTDSLLNGKYSVVFMGYSQMLSRISRIEKLADVRLSDGIDYLWREASVQNGKITSLENIIIPKLDEEKLYYTDAENTSYTANKSTIPTGALVCMRAEYRISDEYVTSGQRVQLDIPSGMHLIENSITVDGVLASYTTTGDTVTVFVNKSSGIVRFYAAPLTVGNHMLSAFLSFDYEGNSITQPLGTSVINSTALELNAPSVTGRTLNEIRGVAPLRSSIALFSNGVKVADTISNAAGTWFAEFNNRASTDYSEQEIYAEIITNEGASVKSETKTMTYIKDNVDVSKITMINHGQNIALNFLNYPRVTPQYTFAPSSPNFTFEIEFTDSDSSRPQDVSIVTKSASGDTTRTPAYYNPSTNTWVGTQSYTSFNVPVSVGVDYNQSSIMSRNAQITMASDLIMGARPKPPATIGIIVEPRIDPSGYVYEAVASNRLPAVTTTAYHKSIKENEWGEEEEIVVLWDALDYDQANPLSTDADGRYAWDVPIGMWQVKYEKDDYETTFSEWLPVPPPQTEVNIGMISYAQPMIDRVIGYEDYIEVVFDKYMDITTINDSTILISQNGRQAVFDIEYVDQETNPSDENQLFARVIHLKPIVGRFNMSDSISLTIKETVSSYSGVRMSEDITQNVPIKPEPKLLVLPNEINLGCGEATTLEVSILPLEAAVDKKITAVSDSPFLVNVDAEAVTNVEGKAVFNVKGELSGAAELTFCVDGALIQENVHVNVALPPQPEVDYQLDINTETGGVITVGESGMYTPGQDVNISATADNGYIFSGWTTTIGSFVNASRPSTTFTMPSSNATITATYTYIGVSADQDTRVLLQKTNDGSVTASYFVSNETGGILSVNLILAVYNERGQLQSIEQKLVPITGATLTESISTSTPIDTGRIVRAFIWDTSFVPLCNAAELIT